eukprot:6491227-Amphidinium_carterae.1
MNTDVKLPDINPHDEGNALYWDLDATRLTKEIRQESNYCKFIGLSGSGKTRTLYEECINRERTCVYVTMSQARNGGSRAAEDMVQKVTTEKLAGEKACYHFAAVLYAHVKVFCMASKWPKLERFFLMTQNCHSAVSTLVNGLPRPTTEEQAVEWTRQMEASVGNLTSKAGFGDVCILLDEIQVVTEEESGRRKNTRPARFCYSLDFVLSKENTNAHLRERRVPLNTVSNDLSYGRHCFCKLPATRDIVSQGAKVEWKDVNGPELLTWPQSQGYMEHYAPTLASWFADNGHYKAWFELARARVVALLVEKCRYKTAEHNFAVELEKLHAEVCDPAQDACLLHSNLQVKGNLQKVVPATGQTFARHLAEAVVFGEINGEAADPFLADVVLYGVGTGVQSAKLEPLALDCLKRIPGVMAFVPEVLKAALRQLNPSCAGFLFEYPVAYAVAEVAEAEESFRLEELHFLHQSLAEAVETMQNSRMEGWRVVFPDRLAGPDVVLFKVEADGLKKVKVVQSKLHTHKLTGKDLKHALDTTDLKLVYTRKQGGTKIMTKANESQEIKEFAKHHADKIERILVCSAGIEGERGEVRVITRSKEEQASQNHRVPLAARPHAQIEMGTKSALMLALAVKSFTSAVVCRYEDFKQPSTVHSTLFKRAELFLAEGLSGVVIGQTGYLALTFDHELAPSKRAPETPETAYP